MKTKYFHSSRGCLSYVTFNLSTKEAVLIDPSLEIGERVYMEYLQEMGLSLKYIIETHTHADHVSIAKEMQLATTARIVRHTLAPSPTKDIEVEGGEKLMVGDEVLEVLGTPGHTNESISLYNGREVFTGDALLIDATGRTDFQVGDSATLYKSIHRIINELPPETLVRPAHDYHGRNQVTLKDELHTNPRVMMGESEFIQIMDAHHPPKPELFDYALSKNSE